MTSAASQDVQEMSFEDVSEIKKKITLKVGASQYKQHFERELSSVASKANFKGFRPGKVPRAMVEKMHGGTVRLQVIDRLVNSSIQQVAKTRELDVINVTDLDIDPQLLASETTGDIQFSAVLVLYPKPEVKEYKKLAVTVSRPKAGDKEVQDVIKRMLESRASLKPVTDRKKPQAGDVINAEVQIIVSGEDEAGRPEPMTAEFDDPNIPDEVKAQLPEISLEETREIPVTFPDEHRDPALRGKSATYKITLKGLSEKVLPELDDEFAKSVGLGAENSAQLNEKVAQSLQSEIEQRAKSDAEVEVLKLIIERNPFEVPEMLVDDEIRNLAVRAGVVDTRQVDPSKIPVDVLRPGLGEAALQRVKASIVVDRIAEKENLRATSEELQAKITQLSEEFGVPEAEVKKYVFQDGRGVNVLMDITRSKVMDFLLADTKIEYKDLEAEDGSEESKKSRKGKAEGDDKKSEKKAKSSKGK